MHRLKLSKTRNSSSKGSKSARSEHRNYRIRKRDEQPRPYSCMPDHCPGDWAERPSKQQNLTLLSNLKRKTRKKKATKKRTSNQASCRRKRPCTPQNSNSRAHESEKKSRRRIQTAHGKYKKLKHQPLESSFCNIYEDFKNATPHPIQSTHLFSSPDMSDESISIPDEKEYPYSNRPHTSSGINLADYKFGTFKTIETKSRAKSAPLSRVGRRASPRYNQENDARPPTRQRPPPEALHLELPIHYRLNSSHQSYQTNRPLTSKELPTSKEFTYL